MFTFRKGTVAVAVFSALVAFGALRADDDKSADGGLRISPVPLDLAGKNRELVSRGSYLVNAAAACNDCHTQPNFAPDGDPYKGQPEAINAAQFLAGGRVFGDVISPNITPDESGKPGGLSYAQFKSVMRTGADPDEPDELLQVMPWPVYRNLSDRDLRAIYEYLRAIPSLPDNPNPSP
jgi:cytochrome c553